MDIRMVANVHPTLRMQELIRRIEIIGGVYHVRRIGIIHIGIRVIVRI
ncbi:MAG: hypothetical protein HZA12_00185 [Nitrospirae bacterium]|nr:hypothetical protein [Nitrospirota bacterium]